MPIENVAKVLQGKTGLPSTAKLILIGLSNHGDPDGSKVYPSVARLAWYAECDERTVRRWLPELEKAGFIDKVRKPRQHLPAEYRIRVGNLSALERLPDNDGIPEWTPTVSRVDIAVSTETSETSEETSRTLPASGAEEWISAEDAGFLATPNGWTADQAALIRKLFMINPNWSEVTPKILNRFNRQYGTSTVETALRDLCEEHQRGELRAQDPKALLASACKRVKAA
jgi:DNA-binding PadR family transcriptional regulator